VNSDASGVDRTEGDVNASPRRAQWQQEHLSAETRRLLDEDARYFLHQSLSTPCLNALQSCAGSELIDLEGRAILDFHGNSAHHVGYGHPRVVQAVRDQLDTLPFSPRRYTNRPAVDLARRLSQLAPMPDARVLFAPGGAAAISMALKLARIATGRHKTISFWGAFHGASLDAISIGGEDMFRDGVGPLLPGAFHVTPPGEDDASAQTSLNEIAAILEREGDIAAIIAEPMRCTTVIQPPATYWQHVRQVCDQHGALLIFDEIPIGLGRTGRMFACEYAGVAPDIVCLGKGLGGGIVPMAAMIARGTLNVAAASSIGHFTHEKSPIGAAAALATLDVIESERLIERANVAGAEFAARLRDLAQKHSMIAEVRAHGMLIGVELRDSNRRTAEDIAEALLYACLNRGLSFKISSGRVLTLAPPLTISDHDLNKALAILDNAFVSVLATKT
jgi:4-aminobutyrate aminotransferase